VEPPALRPALAEDWSQPLPRLHVEGGVDSKGRREVGLSSPFQNRWASCRRRQRQQATGVRPAACRHTVGLRRPHNACSMLLGTKWRQLATVAAPASLICRITPARPETLGRGRAAAARPRKATLDDPLAQITLRAVVAVEANAMVGVAAAGQCLSACVLIRRKVSALGRERWPWVTKHAAAAIGAWYCRRRRRRCATLTPHSAPVSDRIT
jgi:hypothetical protein